MNLLSDSMSTLMNISFVGVNMEESWGIRDLQVFTLGCHASCFSCSGPSQEECTKCSDGYFAQGSLCIVNCSSKTFGDRVSATCLPCDDSCLECFGTSDDQCLICPRGLFLLNGFCLDDCGSGYYTFTNQTNMGETCLMCDGSCETCNGPLSTNCLSCDSNSNLFFFNNQCIICNEKCSLCKGPTESDCIECSFGYFMYKKNCIDYVPNGFFSMDINETIVLVQCHSSCQTCKNITEYDCLTCRNGMLKSLTGQCLTGCDSGSYFSISDAICMPCDQFCRECDGGSPSNCTGNLMIFLFYYYKKSLN